MTVYELIQELAAQEADDEVEFQFELDKISHACTECGEETTVVPGIVTTGTIDRVKRYRNTVTIEVTQ